MSDKTKAEIEKQISLLEEEVFANEEENRMYQHEIDSLQKVLDSMS